MKGYKTWIAAIGLILGGLSIIAIGVGADPIDFSRFAEAWAMIMAGLAAIGIGHKVEKNGSS